MGIQELSRPTGNLLVRNYDSAKDTINIRFEEEKGSVKSTIDSIANHLDISHKRDTSSVTTKNHYLWRKPQFKRNRNVVDYDSRQDAELRLAGNDKAKGVARDLFDYEGLNVDYASEQIKQAIIERLSLTRYNEKDDKKKE